MYMKTERLGPGHPSHSLTRDSKPSNTQVSSCGNPPCRSLACRRCEVWNACSSEARYDHNMTCNDMWGAEFDQFQLSSSLTQATETGWEWKELLPEPTLVADETFIRPHAHAQNPIGTASRDHDENAESIFCHFTDDTRSEVEIGMSDALYAKDEEDCDTQTTCIKGSCSHKVYRCELAHCNKTFATRPSLARHRRDHNPPSFSCLYPGCRQLFKRKDHLKVHIRRQHHGSQDSGTNIMSLEREERQQPLPIQIPQSDPRSALGTISTSLPAPPTFSYNDQCRPRKRTAGVQGYGTDDPKKNRTETYLEIIYEPANPASVSLDVIFVHGIRGDPITSFTATGSKHAWMRESLPLSIPRARIMTVAWDAEALTRPVSDSENRRGLLFSDALLDKLLERRSDGYAKCRPIVFVAHSLGGVMVKAALVRAHQRPSLYKDILSSTRSILFFGTPHQGAGRAASTWNLETSLKRIGQAVGVKNQKSLSKLQNWSERIADLGDDFAELAGCFDIVTLYETIAIGGILPVPRDLASVGTSNERSYSLEVDHSNLSREAWRFEQVREVFSQFGSHIDGAGPIAITSLDSTRPTHSSESKIGHPSSKFSGGWVHVSMPGSTENFALEPTALSRADTSPLITYCEEDLDWTQAMD